MALSRNTSKDPRAARVAHGLHKIRTIKSAEQSRMVTSSTQNPNTFDSATLHLMRQQTTRYFGAQS